MDLFSLIDENGPLHPVSPDLIRRLQHRSPLNSPSRLSMPDLSETDQSASEGEKDLPNEKEKQALLTTEMKLEKARERREEIKKMRKIHVMDKNQQAIERAQKNIDNKRELLRQQSSRIEKVKARREKMEEKEKKRVLASIENKLNSAVSRAEQISKKKQIKAKNMRRLEKAKKRREISEFERRSNLLSSVDRRSNLAQKNMEMLLKDRQCKAREQIEHAQRVSSRVRAARILQRAMRSIFGVKEPKDQGSAAIKIQCWAPWRVNVACRRLFSHSGETTAALDSLRLLLSSMGHGTKRRRSCSSFDNLTTMMTKDVTIDAAKKFLATFDPIFGNAPCISSRTILSAFLVSQEPIAVLGPKRSTDRCSILLENASHRLLESLTDLVLIDPSCEEHKNCASLVATTASSLMSYCTLFDKWKNSDKEELVAQMSKSAMQSWVAYLVAKDTLLYIEEKENEIMGNNDPFFQQKVRCSSAKKGSWSHIKRIRTSLEKLLGKEDGLEVMKKAKRSAIAEVDRESLLIKAKVEIDDIKDSDVRKSEANVEDTPKVDLSDSAALDDVNEHVVHEILLADNNDIAAQLFQEPAVSICDCVDSFMAKYVDSNSMSSDTSEVSVEMFAFTMEKAYFDQMKDDWVLRKNLRGVRDMVVELLAKMRKLVPNRKDLHDFFSEKEARSCSNAMDFLALLIRISEVMGDSLESPARAKSTLKWRKATVLYGCGKSAVPFNLADVESYVVTSIAFLVKKLDVCHADIVNFKLMKVTPLIRNNGIYYERKRFIERCGGSLEDLHGTRSWIARVNQVYEDCNSNLSISLKLKKGFVDEILFVRERIAMPEVLCLDADRIGSIRERVQRIVISSALFLHTCTIMHIRSTHFDQNLLVKIGGHKDALMKALRNNLSFDELLDRSISTILSFIKDVSKREVDEEKLQRLRIATEAVLKGSDPVLSLMDKRIRDVLKTACILDIKLKNRNDANVPVSLNTGIKGGSVSSGNSSWKERFGFEMKKYSAKLGFTLLSDDIVDVSFDAFKVIDHCIKVHEEHVFIPLVNEL